MRSRKGFENRLTTDPEEHSKSGRGALGPKRTKTYIMLLVSFIGILTVIWLCFLSNDGNKLSELQQQQQQALIEIKQQLQDAIPADGDDDDENNEDNTANNFGVGGVVVDDDDDDDQAPNKDKYTDRNLVIPVIDDKNDKNGINDGEEEKTGTPLHDDEMYLSKIVDAGKAARNNDCVHKPKRDYQKYPVNVIGHSASREILDACDIPCVYNSGSYNYADASLSGPQGCAHTNRITFSMESVINYPSLRYEAIHNSGHDIAATYELDSDVPLPYFSWAEYNLRQKPLEKTATAMVAMFVSNCGASNNRLEYVKALMDNGITVHSYGRCMHNADAQKNSNNYNDVKGWTIARYKFTIAMENSNTKDYVTEKLYTPLSWGTVPIHMGLTNIHDYAPEHSVISVHDFNSPKELAEYLKELDRNETKYAEYLAWKDKPFTNDFKAMMDISKVHSACRMCIKAADLNRLKYGPETRPANMPTFTKEAIAENKGALPLWVRERGKYWPFPVFVADRTVAGLKKAVLDVLRPVGTEERTEETVVWAIYDRYTRITKDAYIKDDAVVEEMVPFTELEAIIVN